MVPNVDPDFSSRFFDPKNLVGVPPEMVVAVEFF